MAVSINRKSHTGFLFVPTSMTLNDLERCNSPYFAYFSKFDSFADRLRQSEDRPIMSAKYGLPVTLHWAKINLPCSVGSVR